MNHSLCLNKSQTVVQKSDDDDHESDKKKMNFSGLKKSHE